MSKDPAFLFYPNDFTTGTQFFSDQQVGIYVRILCAQHQHGHLNKSKMRKLCDGITDADAKSEILAKFSIDSNGHYFNQRLDGEVLKRKEHSTKQRQNAMMRWHKTGKDLAMPLEDEDEDENVIESKNRKSKFKAPTVAEVAAYMSKINYPEDHATASATFVDYYTSNGWKVGKNPMKDWSATVRRWMKTRNDSNTQSNARTKQSSKTGGFTDQELASALAHRHNASSNE